MIKRNVVIKTSFPATHRWSKCPLKSVKFLREEHRHVFHLTFKFKVTHSDRDIEFIDMKQTIDRIIQERYAYQNLGETSCEQIGDFFLEMFTGYGLFYVSVFEDDENGAECYEE